MIYIMYILLLIITLLVYHFDAIYYRLKPFIFKTKHAIRNPRVTRDVSLATMVNGLFNVLSASSLLGILGYLLLTLVGLVGIIVANDKIQD